MKFKFLNIFIIACVIFFASGFYLVNVAELHSLGSNLLGYECISGPLSKQGHEEKKKIFDLYKNFVMEKNNFCSQDSDQKLVCLTKVPNCDFLGESNFDSAVNCYCSPSQTYACCLEENKDLILQQEDKLENLDFDKIFPKTEKCFAFDTLARTCQELEFVIDRKLFSNKNFGFDYDFEIFTNQLVGKLFRVKIALEKSIKNCKLCQPDIEYIGKICEKIVGSYKTIFCNAIGDYSTEKKSFEGQDYAVLFGVKEVVQEIKSLL